MRRIANHPGCTLREFRSNEGAQCWIDKWRTRCNPDKAKAILDRQRSDYTETEVAQVKLPRRPGELARGASRLGDAGININYGYCGTEPNTNATFLIFGVAEVGKAVNIFEQAAAAGGTT